MNNNRTELSVNTEVLEKMAEIAAKEVDGVIGIAKRAIDLKGAVKSKNAFKGVKIESINGAVKIKVYICVAESANVKTVAEKVQQIVKDKVQNMTGTAVTQVDVIVADVKFSEDANA
ncbi:MAG: Asp23/Gls24 family envelope stress response protein [Clostridia bacterium]|nr:Asp23/Gls24 family envelope stress response protein [Clostridia bacterium]